MAKIGIGVDVGGTSVKLGMFTRTGNLIKKWEIPTDRENNCANVIPDVAASIRETLEEEGFSIEDLVGVGLGVPGPVQPTGYVEVCVNLHWKDRYPGRELSELLDGAGSSRSCWTACGWKRAMTPMWLPSEKPGKAAAAELRTR